MKTYLASYRFEGQEYGLELKAESVEEAKARVKALAWARLDGELMASVPAIPGAGLLARLFCWLRNAWAS